MKPDTKLQSIADRIAEGKPPAGITVHQSAAGPRAAGLVQMSVEGTSSHLPTLLAIWWDNRPHDSCFVVTQRGRLKVWTVWAKRAMQLEAAPVSGAYGLEAGLKAKGLLNQFIDYRLDESRQYPIVCVWLNAHGIYASQGAVKEFRQRENCQAARGGRRKNSGLAGARVLRVTA